jgi:hypothetical protein
VNDEEGENLNRTIIGRETESALKSPIKGKPSVR